MIRHYQIKSDIIKVLAEHEDSFELSVPAVQRLIHFNKIQDKLASYSKNELLDNLHLLWDKKYIACSAEKDNSKFAILTEGRAAYVENKFLLAGEDEELKLKKSKIDLKNAERVHKTYSSTRFMTVAAFIISLVLLFLKLAEVLNIWPYLIYKA